MLTPILRRFLLLLSSAATVAFADPIRVACLGDSITFGARANPATDAYPVQLQPMLGPGYVVKNFARSGATLWHGGKPNAFEQLPPVKEFAPQIAVVMFGINDTRNEGVDYWTHFDEFEHEGEKLLDALLAQTPSPRILLCLPTPSVPKLPGLTDERRAVLIQRIPRLAQVRAKLLALAHRYAGRGVEVVDMEAATADRPELYFTDAVHFNPKGYRVLAETVRPRIEALGQVIGNP